MRLLPSASKECQNIYQESINVNGECSNCKANLQEYDETQNQLEIKKILDDRKSMKEDIDVTKNVNKKDKASIKFEKDDDREL